MHLREILLVSVFGMAVVPHPARGEAEAAARAWASVQEIAKDACQAESQTVVLAWDPEKKLLKVGRETRLNPAEVLRETQVVPIRELDPEIAIEGVGAVANPWVKVRCRAGRTDVQTVKERVTEGEVDDESRREDEQAFLIIPCRGREAPKLADALRDFLKAAGS